MRPRRPACAGWPSRGRCARRACSRSRSATWRSSGSTPGALDAAGAEELGRGLAADPRGGRALLRRRRADRTRASRHASARCGCPTTRPSDWPSFYAERRLRPLARLARERGALPERGDRVRSSRCASACPSCAGPPEPPARLHGDLWSGNVMADEDGRPWLIDPSAYGGHREVDLAMLRLFGAPSRARVRGLRGGRAAGGGLGGARRALPAAAAARARAAVRRLLPRRRRTRRPPLRRLTRTHPVSRTPRPAGRGRSERGVCARTRSRPRRRLYLLARVVVARHYRRRLTLAVVARALASSPRQVQRAYAQFGEMTFQEDLLGAAHGRGRRAAGRAARDPRGGCRPPRRLPPGAPLRPCLPPPLRPVPGALSRASRAHSGAALVPRALARGRS